MANYRIGAEDISKNYQRQQKTIHERQQQPPSQRSGNYRVNAQGEIIQPQRVMEEVHLEENVDRDYFENVQSVDSNVYQFDDYRVQELERGNHSYDEVLARQRGRSLGQYDRLNQAEEAAVFHQPKAQANHRLDQRSSLQKWQQQLQQVVSPIKDSPSIQRLPRGRVKLFSVFALIYMIMLICGWQLLPFNKVNQIVVAGNQFVSSEAISKSSRIRTLDTIDEVFTHRQRIETAIIEENPIIESIVMTRDSWDHLLIQVNEHQLVAKVEQGEGGQFEPILTNGDRFDDAAVLASLTNESLENLPTLVDFNQKGKLIELATILRQVNPEVLAQIGEIHLSDNPRKPNGIEVQMKDGNQIKAIISTFAQKVNYYPAILDQLAGATGTINFEVGAYFTPGVANANTVNLETD